MEYSTSNVSPGRIKLSLKKIVPPFYGMKKDLPRKFYFLFVYN